MKMKNFSSILKEAASLYEAARNHAFASDIRRFVDRLKPFEKLEAVGLFKLHLTGLGDHSSGDGKDLPMTARDLSVTLAATAALLKSAGSSSKSRDLISMATEIGSHSAFTLDALIDGLHEERRKAMAAKAEQYVRRLTDTQQNETAFNATVAEIKKESVDLANAVAVLYVQGKSKYASKPKAVAAIVDKRFERVRLAAKMAD
jgi:hypothetical protein